MSFLKKLNKLNTERQQEWDPEAKVDILFRALEHVAEAGEKVKEQNKGAFSGTSTKYSCVKSS